MRLCFDSITAADIPDGSALVAGYVDGDSSQWSDADWQRFPGRTIVRISVLGNDADVLDVERGAAMPSMATSWAHRQREAGRDPTVYVNLANVDEVRSAFEAAGEPQPLYWLAHYGAPAVVPDGYVALQYANAAMTGGHYDASVVKDFWPGIDKEDEMTDDELRAAIKRIYAGPGSLEEMVKADVRVMVTQDPETRAAIVGAVKEKLG